MKYITFLLCVIILAFSTVYIYNVFTLKYKWKENLKISSLFLLFSVPIALFMFVITFVILKCTNWTLPIDISNYKIFIISFASIFIVFIGEFIIKIVLSNFISKYFENKYKGQDLSQEQMMKLIKGKHKFIESLKVASILVISFIICFIITSKLKIENNIITSIITSIANSISYLLMFKSK